MAKPWHLERAVSPSTDDVHADITADIMEIFCTKMKLACNISEKVQEIRS